MNTTLYRVSLSYTKLGDGYFGGFASGVHSKLYGNPAFSAPPVTGPELLESINAFTAAKIAQPTGGKAATAEKNICRLALVRQLRDLALYVQIASDNNLALLLESGFDSASTNRARSPLERPTILRIQHGLSGHGQVTVGANRNARAFEIRVAEMIDDTTAGPFRPVVVRTGSRNMDVDGLTPGKLFIFQVRAVGGLEGYSDWSDAVVHRAA